MRRSVLLLALTACPVWAQLSILLVPSEGVETLVTESLLELGAAHPGDMADTRFRLRNATPATIVLSTLRVAGAGFTLENYPTLPYRVASGTNVDFRVRFRPAAPGVYSATFQVNEQAIILRAQGRDGVTVLGPDGAPLSADLAHDFGRVEVGSSIEQQFLIRNNTTGPLFLASVTVTGEAFAATLGAGLPYRLEPGNEIALRISFAPARSGIPSGLLTVDGRVFRLQGFAVSPQIPDAIFTVVPVSPSAKQIPVSIRLAAPAPVDIAGTVTVEFLPESGLGDDPAIQWMPSASRLAQVSIAKGSLEALWGAGNSAGGVLQTGTTAGEIILRTRIGDQPREARITIARAAPVIATVTAARGPAGIEIGVDGFDNTRSTAEVRYSFFDPSGARIGEPLAVAIGDQFARYFAASGLGGLFRLGARIPLLAGDAAGVAAMELELRNAVGVSTSGRVRF
ncbi:MAG: choice-of-anchor D domain-containing protein [Bryobacteraceae bacterium]